MLIGQNSSISNGNYKLTQSIIKNTDFQYEFTNEFWAGKYHLNSGDDKFLTRWMQNNGWKTHIQASPETMIKSTFKNNWRFILQLLRWTRNSWRSDIKALLFERTIWKRYPYTAFTMLDRFFNPITVFFGPVSVGYIIYKTQVGNYGFPIWVYLVSYLTYLFASRFVKYTPHFVLRPFDILYLPVLLLFNFAFPVLKLYCLCTLSVTNWGTRKGADATKDQEELEYVGQKYVSTSISRKPTIKLDLEAAMNRRNSSMMTDSIVAFPIIAGSEVSYQGSNSVSEIRDSDQSSIVSDIEGSVRESGRHV